MAVYRGLTRLTSGRIIGGRIINITFNLSGLIPFLHADLVYLHTELEKAALAECSVLTFFGIKDILVQKSCTYVAILNLFGYFD